MEQKSKKETSKAKAIRQKKILEILDAVYPRTKCHLDYETPWQLLFATILSAQCTDKRVNMITKVLFAKYPNLEAFASATQEEMEDAVREAGFFRNKALHIRQTAAILLTKYNGELPSSIEELTSLPGVGRKTANVIRCHVFGEPSIVVDTHVKRISKLLGFTDTIDPEKAEYELMQLLPEEHWIRYNVQIIDHGRAICISGRPKCEICPFRELCPGSRI